MGSVKCYLGAGGIDQTFCGTEWDSSMLMLQQAGLIKLFDGASGID